MKEEVQIRRLGKQDIRLLQKLIRFFQEVFEMEKSVKVNESYLTGLLSKPEFIAYCAILRTEIVGGITAYALPMYYSANSELFIYDMAVKAEFQRKGIGRKLLSSVKEYGKQNGMNVLFVAANEEDKHALDFYHATGGTAEKVVHFNFILNK